MTILARCCVCSFIIFIHWCSIVPAQAVEIPDPNLRQAILEELELSENAPITQQEMLRLMTLEPGEKGIIDLTGLEYATNLTSLLLYLNPIVDISPLSQLTKLRTIHFWGCNVVDLNPLRNLKNLRLIILANNDISDISSLSELTNLTYLDLGGNRIVDVSPLANLTLLEELWLNKNAITDVSPLIGLRNLTKLYLANNPFHDFGPLLELEGVELDLDIDLSRLDELNIVVGVPDPNLKKLIREALSLPEGVALTQQQMLRLTGLDAGGDRGITDLTGLEYATNLQSLGLYHNPIVNIGPLAYLTKLAGFNLWGCRIVDLSPLRNLKNLKLIILGNNAISDISPLSKLTNLTYLDLARNLIVDFSPLAGLVNLEKLFIQDNFGTDISSLQGLNLTQFSYDEICDIEPLLPSARERIENRSLPSVFQAWDNVVGLDQLTWEERNVLHDLHFSLGFALNWDRTLTEPTGGLAFQLAGKLEDAREIRQRRLDQNPNMVFLGGVAIHGYSSVDAFPPESDFWLRDENNQIVRALDGNFLINFLKSEVQDLIVKQIIAIARCGLFDGVMLDGFNHHGTGFIGRRHFHPVTDEEIIQVYLNIFRAVRSQVREDFLILINANRSKATRFAEYVNGTFMETLTDALGGNPGGYTYDGLVEIESTLTWSEENLRSPQINCLEGWGIPTEPPDSPDNRRWMRVFTTMSLTLSDGYVMYNDGRGVLLLPDPGDGYPWQPGHEHIWYSFWDANLGHPVDPKAQQHQNIDGLFIREFTNGWAVYNRSGSTQEISLAESATGVASGQAGTTHRLVDLDGEIYLTSKSFADVNGDGRVNILDIIQVANGLGKSAPDPNGDGAVNILDLVFVASHLSQ